MVLGRIIGKINTTHFTFKVEGNPKKFEYIQVYHPDYEFVLCQIMEIERKQDITIANCIIIGYRDKDGRIKQIRTPFDPGQEILRAEDDFIKQVILSGGKNKGAYMGKLEGKDIPIHLELNRLLTKHVAVLAKTGAGKSYTVGALIEELMDRKVPLIIIDPHGEYGDVRFPNDNKKEPYAEFGIQPQGYYEHIIEYGNPEIKKGLRIIKLDENMTTEELVHVLPSKLSAKQMSVLYSTIKDLENISFSSLLLSLEEAEDSSKWNLISIIDYLQKMDVFSGSPTPLNEIVQPGRCSIINLKGIEPDVQEIIVYKLMRDLFTARKKGKIPPFFTIIEEAHNFCPERSFGEAKSSKILRTVASEGRKFGMGICIVSQRPARVDKNVLSQCGTQFILKVTNPSDIKAITSSVEGITAESGNEIVNLPIGSAMITGMVDVPLFVRIRPRKTKHGGRAQEMITLEDSKEFLDDLEDFKGKEIRPIIRPNITKKDIMLMSDKKIKKIKTVIVPAALFNCYKDGDTFDILINLANKGIFVEDGKYQLLPELEKLPKAELALLKQCFMLKRFKMQHLISLGFKEKDEEYLKHLVEKGYLREKEGAYSLGRKYILTALKSRSFPRRVEYLSVNYDSLAKKTIELEEMKQKLSKFVKVMEHHDCFIIEYNPVYEGE